MLPAGGIPTIALTALQGVDDTLEIKSGENVIVHGASGNVGMLALQFAKARGARVLASASGRDGAEFVKRLGADAAIDGKRATLQDAVAEMGATLIGSAIWSKYKKWPVYSKFFDNMGPIPHHMHQSREQAALLGLEGKPESYYFPPQHNPVGNNFYPTYRQFVKSGSIPNASLLIVTLDEHPDSINDAAFATSVEDNQPVNNTGHYIDVPANFHNGGAGFSFADGHAETHGWRDPAVIKAGKDFAAGKPVFNWAGGNSKNPDFQWIYQRYKHKKWAPL